MPRWVLGCPECGEEFTHSEIGKEYRSALYDSFAWIGEKPEIPREGVSLECPNCSNVSVYKRHQLTYKAT